MLAPARVIEILRNFTEANLGLTLAKIESAAGGVTVDSCTRFLADAKANNDMLSAAAEMKRLAGQVNVVIHALGILLCLPHILERDERVEYVSLGAGNTGRAFDLETTHRVAEFKFITWRGGPESIRQNGIFKDFFLLADSGSPKRKYLYLLGTAHAVKFFNGRRALPSVLSKDNKVRERFYARYGEKFERVCDYYQEHRHIVSIEDMSPWLPGLANAIADGALVADGPS